MQTDWEDAAMKAKPIVYYVLKPIVKFLFFLLYHPSFSGKENIPKKGGIVLAGNHTKSLDCLMLICSTRRCVHFLGKSELFKWPFKLFFKSVGVIPVNRQHGKGTSALRAAINLLRQEKAIGIFPEGGVNKSDELLLPFKIGAIKMAKATNSKIVPFTISGSYRIFRRGPLVTYYEPISVFGDSLTEESEKLASAIRLGLENSNRHRRRN